MSKIELKLQFPYVVQTQYEHRTTADAYLQYHCVQRTKSAVALNVVKLFVPFNLKRPTGHDGGGQVLDTFYTQNYVTYFGLCRGGDIVSVPQYRIYILNTVSNT